MKGLPIKGGWVVITKVIPTEFPVHRFGIYYAVPTGEYYFKNERHVSHQFHYTPHNYEYPYSNLLSIYEDNLDILKREIWNFCRSNPHYEPINQRGWKLMDSIGKEELEDTFEIIQQVKVITEHGEIVIQPEEYEICTTEKLNDYMKSVADGHGFMVYLSKSGQLKGKVAEQVFYLRSRGISFTQALQMCIGQVSTANLFYIYMHPGYVEYFTREPLLSNYYNSHLKAMRKSGCDELADQYLEQIKEVNGYTEFEEDHQKEIV